MAHYDTIGFVMIMSRWEAYDDRFPKPDDRLDNGPDSTSKLLDQWAYLNGVGLGFSRSGKPTDNAFIEPFNNCFQQECLNENRFLSLEDARKKEGEV